MSAGSAAPLFVWAVILDWREPGSARQCAKILLNEPALGGVVLVHNEQPDESGPSRPAEGERPGGVPIYDVYSASNRGFAAGVNLGIDLALEQGAQAVLLLNDDLVLCEGSLGRMVASVGKGVGAVGAEIRFPGSAPGEAGPVQCLGGGFVSRWRGKTVPRLRERQRLDYVTGACLLLTPEGLGCARRLDERYFMYWEDVALGAQLRHCGLTLVTAEGALGVHARSASRKHAGHLLDAYDAWSASTFASSATGLVRFTIPLRVVLVSIVHLVLGRAAVARAKMAGRRIWLARRGVRHAYIVAGELRAVVSGGEAP